MPDKNIGSLPQVPTLDDSSLMVVEQQGQAMKMTGAQFKEFGKQGLVADMQGYVNAAQQAAEEAQGAVDAVLDMTVEAHNLENSQNATVSKSMKNGVFNLDFGLPRGPEGKQGPEGKEGQRGPKGDPGNGLKILGYYDTAEDLEAAQPYPSPGDAYGIGTQAPYDIYVYDGVNSVWKNNGPLSGGGSVPPENVVTAEGGATMEFTGLGNAPFAIEINDEEEPPLSAADISYKDSQNVEEALDGLFTSVSSGKSLIASAITDKGVPTEEDADFAEMADNIRQIPTGASTGDATATPGDILAPKTAYTATGKVEGIIPTLAGRTITPGTADQTIANGQYIGGTQVIKGDTNLVSSNIKKGVTIFGVTGAVEQNFLATLTVTVDVGAVVTAKNGSTEVSALSTTGTVTLELPIEGQWTVTAVRGVAQYNSVVVNVTSGYTASLTAVLHIEYYGKLNGDIDPYGAGTVVGNYALLGYGRDSNGTSNRIVNSYDNVLTYQRILDVGAARHSLAAASVGTHALFCGGNSSGVATSEVSTLDENLSKGTATKLSVARAAARGASIGNYALIGGGSAFRNNTTLNYNTVDVYDESLTASTATGLALAESCEAASNSEFALFCGTKATAYDANLTRSIPVAPSSKAYSAARAGNYVLVVEYTAGTQTSTVEAYDLFMTKTQAEPLYPARGTNGIQGTTLHDHALFGDYTRTPQAYVDVYDPYLVRTTISSDYPGAGGSGSNPYAAASNEDYALFAISGGVSAFQYI